MPVQTRASSAAHTTREQSAQPQDSPLSTPSLVTMDPSPLSPTPLGRIQANAAQERSRNDRRRELQEEEEQLDRELAEERIRIKRARLEQLRSAPDEELPLPTSPESARSAPEATSHVFRPLSFPTLSYSGRDYASLKTFIFDCNTRFRLTPSLRTDSDRVAFAVSCLSKEPKSEWVHYISELERDPTFDPATITWREFIEFLENQIADPDTRAVTASARLQQLSQGPRQSVSSFMSLYTSIESELPFVAPEEQRVLSIFQKLRPEIRLVIGTQSALPATRDTLVRLARRIEESQRAAGVWDTHTPTRPIPPAPSFSRPITPTTDPSPSNAAPSTLSSSSPVTPRPPKRTSDGQLICYNCQQPGHLASNCSEPRKPRATCYSCGKPGHYANRCPEVVCRTCGKKGHTAQRCADAARIAMVSGGNQEPLGQRPC